MPSITLTRRDVRPIVLVSKRFGPASGLVAALAVATCGGSDKPTEPQTQQPSLEVVAGGALADTILARPAQALVVQVRGTDGKPASGIAVRFEPMPAADTTRRGEYAVFTCSLLDGACGSVLDLTGYPGGYNLPTIGVAPVPDVDTTDASGRVKVAVRFGSIAGTARVRIVVPLFGYTDSASFTIRPGAAARVKIANADTTLSVGGTVTLRTSVSDRFGNARPEVPALSVSAGDIIDVAPATSTVTARDLGGGMGVRARRGQGGLGARARRSERPHRLLGRVQ